MVRRWDNYAHKPVILNHLIFKNITFSFIDFVWCKNDYWSTLFTYTFLFYFMSQYILEVRFAPLKIHWHLSTDSDFLILCRKNLIYSYMCINWLPSTIKVIITMVWIKTPLSWFRARQLANQSLIANGLPAAQYTVDALLEIIKSISTIGRFDHGAGVWLDKRVLSSVYEFLIGAK